MEHKIVFDAVVVFFESEKKTWSADDKKIDKGHFERRERIAEIKEDVDDA